MGYGGMNGIPMVATSPVRHHDSPVMNPVEIHSYEPPWKALTDFALHTDLDRLNNGPPPPVGGQFQHLVNQVCICTLDILFSSNHNSHNSLSILCFWASDPLIDTFYKYLSIKGSEARKQRPHKLL